MAGKGCEKVEARPVCFNFSKNKREDRGMQQETHKL